MAKIVYCWYCERRLDFEKLIDDKIYLICPDCNLRVYIKEEGEDYEENKE